MANHSLISLSDSEPSIVGPLPTHSGADITIQNVHGSAYVYLGGDDTVSSTNYGFRLSPNFAVSFELPGKDSLYAVTSVDGSQIAVLITGLEQGA